MSTSMETRFWAKVNKAGPVPAHAPHLGPCWEWTGHVDEKGYGRFREGAKTDRAHRTAWKIAHGEPESPWEIDHRCHNRSCVNPAHLSVSTRKQNVENMSGPKVTSKSGIRGVFRVRDKWRAQVSHNYRRVHVGYFDTLAEAEAAVKAKRNELFTNNLIDQTALTAAA